MSCQCPARGSGWCEFRSPDLSECAARAEKTGASDSDHGSGGMQMYNETEQRMDDGGAGERSISPELSECAARAEQQR
jgi:hypothetical protein